MTASPGKPGHVVIVGAGHAGFQCASSLRKDGYAGSLSLIDADPFPPYEKPCLSKEYLLRGMEPEQAAFRPPSYYVDNDIALYTGRRVTGIDAAGREVTLEDGRRIHYSHLVLAPGSRVSTLEAPGDRAADDICYIKTLADVHVIRERLQGAARVVVIGSGFTAVEFAATAASLGKSVRLLVRGKRILAHSVAPEMSGYLEALHRSRGVEILHGRAVAEIAREPRGGLRIRDSAGETHYADLVVAGIGTVPEVGLAVQAGLECGDGILVDDRCRTSDPRIFAAGDAVRYWHPLTGRSVRIESVANAQGQARTIAANLCGKNLRFDEVPSFWSDQFDAKVQMAGQFEGYDHVVLRGSREAGKFTLLFYKGPQLIAIHTINSPADHLAGKRLLAARESPGIAEVADKTVPLAGLLQKARDAQAPRVDAQRVDAQSQEPAGPHPDWHRQVQEILQ